MRRHLLVLIVIVIAAACSKKSSSSGGDKTKQSDAAAAAAVADAAPDAAPAPKPPGLAADGSGPALPAAPGNGPHIVPPQKFRHSSVRGDFRIYVTASGLVTSWHTVLSARTLDGKPLWKRDNLGRAVAVSADGKHIVANNDAGNLMVLDAATGEPAVPATRLGGRDNPSGSGVYVSAFAWTPDGQHIIAVDSKHVFVLKADGTTNHEVPVCTDSCFFTAAIALSNEEFLLIESNDTDDKGLQRRKLADGAVVATGSYHGADVVVSPDGKQLLVDGYLGLGMFDAATLAPSWTASVPGSKGVAFEASAEYAKVQFKSMPKLSPDGGYIAVNDLAGQLWLLSAADGKPLVAYPEDVIKFVEDVAWLDAGTLLVIDNGGHVARLAGTPPKLVWSQDDAPEPEQWDEP